MHMKRAGAILIGLSMFTLGALARESAPEIARVCGVLAIGAMLAVVLILAAGAWGGRG